MRSIPVSAYAKAFLEVTEADPKDPQSLVKNLIAVIERNGDWPRREAIVTAVEKMWRAKHDRSLVTIESARKLTESQRGAITKDFPKSFDIKEVQNPELLAGVRMTLNDELERDGSLAHLMNQLFKT
ncbi:MAG: F0F1 ATP synthase subunit delta [bacterium]|nr:F0F1 ATP synthase subunit delta [bacterium]